MAEWLAALRAESSLLKEECSDTTKLQDLNLQNKRSEEMDRYIALVTTKSRENVFIHIHFFTKIISEREFQVGDLVYLRLVPYEILERLGPVAYKLKLPPGCKIHPTFHVSCLKKHLGVQVVPSLTLPRVTEDGIVQDEPLAILERKLVKHGHAAGVDVLVHCKGHTQDDATWEDYTSIKARFPEFIAQGEANFNS